MAHENLEKDLAFIKRTLERAGQYRNIPASGYVAIGLLGFLGAGGTYWLLGPEKSAQLNHLDHADLWSCGWLWFSVLAGAIGSMIVLSILKARNLGIRAWNSLAARMIFSQIPLVLVTGLMTLALLMVHQYALIPPLWLLQYAAISYSFSYFTGPDHKIQGVLFLVLGSVAFLGPGHLALPLLAAGFGGVHLVFGLFRLCVNPARQNEPEQAR